MPEEYEMSSTEARRLVDLYADLILRLAASYLGQVADAEDICQDVLLKLLLRYRRDQAFMDSEHERAWVIRVTINACKDQLKSARYSRVDSLEAKCESTGWDIAAPEHIEQSPTSSNVLAQLQQLPPTWRMAIYLYYYENLSARQIAEMTESSEAAVTARLSRGRRRLCKLLEGDTR